MTRVRLGRQRAPSFVRRRYSGRCARPALAPLVPAGAADRPDTISLMTGSSPEGISAGPGTTFFAGARANGAIYVGDVRERTVRQLVPGRAGEVAVGLLYDAATQRIWVAGGSTGDITAYDSRTGAQLFTVNSGAGRFLNDVAITRDAVYVTDSRNNQSSSCRSAEARACGQRARLHAS